jgi:hypothetical protein
MKVVVSGEGDSVCCETTGLAYKKCRGKYMTLSQISEEILSKRTFFLRNVALFTELGEEDLKVLAKNFHSRKYKKKRLFSTREMIAMFYM